MSVDLTRRELLRAGAAGSALAAASTLSPGAVLEQALSARPRCGKLTDIKHVVILMQENRSFDHYFGTFPGVRGFGDRAGRAALQQSGYPAPGFGGKLFPFRLDAGRGQAQCFNDITHEWGAQHRVWHNGHMDRWVQEHVATDGAADGPMTMGYYTRSDIPFYHALARAFTLCDHYHCSVIGPTDPNRLYAMSGTLDPAGRKGGPLLETLVARRNTKAGAFRWTTMPERLSAHGVSWKHYTSPGGGSFDNVLPYFHNFQTNPTLKARGITPTYPDDFVADIAANRLPQVSWVLPSLGESEHPGFSSAHAGEYAASRVLRALTSNRRVWDQTALFITWDENGGFFDHVAPPTPRAGTRDEFLTVANLPDPAQGIRGPIGLGFRVPMIVASPFSRGGFVSSRVYDHTSILRFLEARFGVEVPNLSRWRRSVTGDLTGAFNFAKRNASVPHLPATSPTVANCDTHTPFPIPPNQLPAQQAGRARRPSGRC
jgi:phospholipase C